MSGRGRKPMAGGGEYYSAADAYGYGQPAFGGPAAAAAPGYGYGAPPFGPPVATAPDMASPLDAEIQIAIRQIHDEMNVLERSGEFGEQFKNARRLLFTEASKLESNIDPEWLEVDISKPIKLTKKVLIPIFRHPKFNFVGKLLGPNGTTQKNIAKSCKCQVYILGQGSTQDRNKEQELLASGHPQYAHYGGPLHVKVETTAPPAQAYERVAGVLQILSQMLQPVKDTPHIEGITTESNPVLDNGGKGENVKPEWTGQQQQMGGSSGGGGGAGGPMKSYTPCGGGGRGGFPPPRGGGSFGSGGGRGGFQSRGGMLGHGCGGGAPPRGFQPY